MKGSLLAATSALLAAGFLIPYKAAVALGHRDGVVVAMLLAAALFNSGAALATQRPTLRWPNRISLVAATVLAAFTVVGNIAAAAALQVQEPAVTSVLLQTQVLITAALAWLLLREYISVRFLAGALITVFGFALMTRPTANAHATTLGILWAVAAAGAFSGMQVFTRWVITRIRPVFINALRLWIAVAGLVAVGGLDATLQLSHTQWFYAAAAAFFGPFLSRLCLMYTVKYITASRGTLVTMVSPIFALVLGLLTFGTLPTTVELIGGGLILAGVVVPVVEQATRTTR